MKKKNTENFLAIIGSRSFDNYVYTKKYIPDIIEKNELSITKIVSGRASRADKIAEHLALNH